MQARTVADLDVEQLVGGQRLVFLDEPDDVEWQKIVAAPQDA